MTSDAARALRLSETVRLARMAEQMAGVGHWHYDLITGRVVWSEQIYRIYGLDPATAREPNLEIALAAYHPDDRPRLDAFVARAAATGEGYQFEMRLLRQGEERIVIAKAETERGPDNAVIAILGILMDVTELKRAEAALRAAKEAAEAATAAKSDFLSNISHELRTPLTALIGFSTLLSESQSLGVAERRFASRIDEAGHALLHIVNDLLDISRIEQRALLLVAAPFAVDDAINEVFETVAFEAASKGLELIASIAPQPLEFLGDMMRVRQILLNLVGNAVKFTRHGEVRVTAGLSPQGALILEVADTGPGIAPAYIASLFDRFTQGDATATRSYGGLGLGLAICKGLTEAMGGAISVDTAPERGTRFRVELPAMRDDGIAAAMGIEPALTA